MINYGKRTNTKIGDIFSVKINENSKKFFQLIAFDLTQLNSDVIRAFKAEYPINSCPDVLEIINGEIEFYAHCITKIGLKLGYWEKYPALRSVPNEKLRKCLRLCAIFLMILKTQNGLTEMQEKPGNL